MVRELPEFARVLVGQDSDTPAVLWHGPRVRMSVCKDEGDELSRLGTTAPPTYQGPLLAKAAALHQVSLGGEVILSQKTYTHLVDDLYRMDNPFVARVESQGCGWFKGQTLYQVFTRGQSRRAEALQGLTRAKAPPSGSSQLLEEWQRCRKHSDEQVGVLDEVLEIVRSTGYTPVCPAPPKDKPMVVVVLDVENAAPLISHGGRALPGSLDLYLHTVRTLLAERGGFEVLNDWMRFVAAFAEPQHALRFALDLQVRLLGVPWDEALLASDGCPKMQRASTGLPLFRGPRVKCGMSYGRVSVRQFKAPPCPPPCL